MACRWTCNACTFEHTGPATEYLACAVCLAQRPERGAVDDDDTFASAAAVASATGPASNGEGEAYVPVPTVPPVPRHPPPAANATVPVLPPRPKRLLPSRSGRRPALVIFDLDLTLWDGDIHRLDPQGEGSIHATEQTPDGVATAIRDSSGGELRVFPNAVAAVKQ